MPQPRRPRRDPNSAEVAEQRYGAAAYDLHRLREVSTWLRLGLGLGVRVRVRVRAYDLHRLREGIT